MKTLALSQKSMKGHTASSFYTKSIPYLNPQIIRWNKGFSGCYFILTDMLMFWVRDKTFHKFTHHDLWENPDSLSKAWHSSTEWFVKALWKSREDIYMWERRWTCGNRPRKLLGARLNYWNRQSEGETRMRVMWLKSLQIILMHIPDSEMLTEEKESGEEMNWYKPRGTLLIN